MSHASYVNEMKEWSQRHGRGCLPGLLGSERLRPMASGRATNSEGRKDWLVVSAAAPSVVIFETIK